MAISNLHLASSRHIIASLSRQRPDFNTRNAWVVNSNDYVVDCLNKLRTHFQPGAASTMPDIIDYISTSINIHCYNSWCYLASAINSYLEGDFSNAIHNAYYSELRSIMSFLATRGVGVFDKNNVIIDDAGVAHKAICTINGEARTHQFAKLAFDGILTDLGRTSDILSSVSIEGHSMKDWFDATSFPPGTNLPTLVTADWLKDWSLDMSIIKNDQDFRNFVSYRPQNFDLNFARQSDDIRARLSFVIELWELCSPTNFYNLSILRNAFEVLYKQLFQYNNLGALDIEKDIKPILIDLGLNPNDQTSSYIISFLRRTVKPANSRVFDFARLRPANPILESDTEPVGILSRACLLALITSKIVESTFRQAGVATPDLRFWYDHIGVKYGYWEDGAPPYLFSDLWADVDLEIIEIKNWLSNNAVRHSTFTYKSDLKAHSTNIRQLNKPYLWCTAS